MSQCSTIARRRALLGAAVLAAGLLAGAVAPPAAHADIGGSRKDTVGGRAAHSALPTRGHPARRPAAVARGHRAVGQ